MLTLNAKSASIVAWGAGSCAAYLGSNPVLSPTKCPTADPPPAPALSLSSSKIVVDVMNQIQLLTLNAKCASMVACWAGNSASCLGSDPVPSDCSTAEPFPTHPEGVNIQTHHVSHESGSFVDKQWKIGLNHCWLCKLWCFPCRRCSLLSPTEWPTEDPPPAPTLSLSSPKIIVRGSSQRPKMRFRKCQI